MANQVKTTFTADTKPQDRAIAKLQADLARYQSQRERDEQRLTRQIEREAESRYRIQVRAQQRATTDILRDMRKIEAEEKRIAARNAGYRQTVAGYIVGGAVGAGYLAQQAIDKAVEQARANRLIASAATEAGIAQDKLAAANKRYAESVGLSTVAAAPQTAQIQRLATYAGRPQDVDRLLRSFADLAAARGIGGRDLEGLIGTILSGQDEGLNRLGISDPGQLQKAYAASIGKTVEQLTQQEKVQAAVNAVMEKAAIFYGASEARLNSLEGQIAKTTAQQENLLNAISTTIATSGPLQDFFNEYSRLLKGIEVDIDAVNRKLREGKSPAEIAREAYPGPSAGDYLSAGVTSLVTRSVAGSLVSRAIFGNAAVDQAQNPYGVYGRRFPDFVAQVQGQEAANEQQRVAAYRQQVAEARRTQEALQREQLEGLSKQELRDRERRAALLLQRPGVTIAELQRGLKDIPGLGLSALDTQDLQQDYQRRIFDEQKRQADELKKKMEEIRKARENAFDLGLSTSQNPFLNLLGNATQRMRTLLETTRQLSPAIRNALIAGEQGRNLNDLTGLRLDTRLDAYSLRNQAAEFRQGYRNDLNDPATVQRILDAQLSILGGRFDPAKDQRLVNIAQGLDPRLLRQDQQYQVASAFEREATRKLESEQQAVDFYQAMQKLITGEGLLVSLRGNEQIVRVINEAPDNAKVSTKPRAADTAKYYTGN